MSTAGRVHRDSLGLSVRVNLGLPFTRVFFRQVYAECQYILTCDLLSSKDDWAFLRSLCASGSFDDCEILVAPGWREADVPSIIHAASPQGSADALHASYAQFAGCAAAKVRP